MLTAASCVIIKGSKYKRKEVAAVKELQQLQGVYL